MEQYNLTGNTSWGTPTDSTKLPLTGGSLSGDFTVDTTTFHVDSTNNRVGIGTSSPDKLFHLERNDTSTSAIAKFKNAGTGDATLQIGTAATNFVIGMDNSDSDKFKFGYGDELQSITGLTIDSSGNLGIGTTSPAAKLHVERSIAASSDLDPTFLFLENASDGGSAIEFKNSVNGKTKLSFGVIGTGANTDDTFIGFETSKNASLGEKMRIDEDGNVGIGTSNPDSLLHVKVSDVGIAAHSSAQLTLERAGTNYLQFLTSATGTSGLLFGDANDIDVAKIVYDHNVPSMQFFTETALAMTIDSSQRVGIGTSNPDRLLHLSGADTAIIRLENTDASLIANQIIGGIEFEKVDPNGAGVGVVGGLRMYSQGVVGENTYLTLSTSDSTTNDVERLRITADGVVLIGSTSETLNSSTHGHAFHSDGATVHSRGVNGANTCFTVHGTAGSFRTKGDGDAENTNNSYGQISDETLKQDIIDATSQWNDIKNLRVRKFRFKDNPTGVLQIGVVAQEIETVSAGLVKTNEEGIKSVKYSVLYMKAVKCLQEAIAKIEVLEAKVAALEAA